MTRTVVARQRAIEDLSQQVVFYKREISGEAGKKLYKAAVQTFALLAEQPGMGAPMACAAIHDLRRWRIKGYEKILIFYRDDEHNLYLIRILHGARDLDSLLDEEQDFLDAIQVVEGLIHPDGAPFQAQKAPLVARGDGSMEHGAWGAFAFIEDAGGDHLHDARAVAAGDVLLLGLHNGEHRSAE